MNPHSDRITQVSREVVALLPKAELHVHIEGTLTPSRLLALSKRNAVPIPFRSETDIENAYQFSDLSSFLDIYYRGTQVLISEIDFYDLMNDYLVSASHEGIVRAEIFFDPQTHLKRGVSFSTFMSGFKLAMTDARARGMSVDLIMCFLRDEPVDTAWDAWRLAQPYLDCVIGVGLDSAEVGYPPELFAELFGEARQSGLRRVAHAGEEGPPAYIWSALDVLGAERIDHGVKADQDSALMRRLRVDSVPLTVCPMSNVKLKVFSKMQDHNLKSLLDAKLKITINSDDPSYFGGFLVDNFIECVTQLGLTAQDVMTVCRNSLEASFASDVEKKKWIQDLVTVGKTLPFA